MLLFLLLLLCTMVSFPPDHEVDTLVLALDRLVPDKQITIREAFGIDSDMKVPFFSTKDSHVPDVDESYRFDPQTTLTEMIDLVASLQTGEHA